jgi:hypothetical protein
MKEFIAKRRKQQGQPTTEPMGSSTMHSTQQTNSQSPFEGLDNTI